MPKLEWLESFRLGVPEIDSDHRAILELTKAAQSAAATGDRQRGEHYLDRLIALLQSHFIREEKFLKKWRYAETKTHARYHAEILQRAKAAREVCATAGTPDAFDKCCEEMMSLLVDDAVRGDMQLKSFFDNAGLSLPA